MSYQWKISAMDYTVSQDGHTNVVNVVHWRVSKDDGGNSGGQYGSVGLVPPSGTFVEWVDITETIAIGWAKAALGTDRVTEIEADIDAQIAEKAAPTIGTGVPWLSVTD